MKALLIAVGWLAFTVFSFAVVAHHGFFGFLTLSAREPWGLQVYLDLAVTTMVAATFVYRDAREHQINAWPYIVWMLCLGAIGLLPYLFHRELKRRRSPVAVPA